MPSITPRPTSLVNAPIECSVCDDREGPFVRFNIPMIEDILHYEAAFIFCQACIARIHAGFEQAGRPTTKDPATLC